MISESLKYWGVEPKNVMGLTHDNARVMVKASETLGFNSILCILHTLNLVVKDAIRANPDIEHLINEVRDIVTYFNHSDPARHRMKNLQKKLGIQEGVLIQDNETRFLL